jgi:hypothetical protein
VGGRLFTYGIVLFVLGIALLAYQLIRVFKRIRFRDTGDPQVKPPGGVNIYLFILVVVFIVIAQSFFWLSSQVKNFRPFGKDGKFATLYVTRTGDPIKSLEMLYIPAIGDSSGVENLFYLSGDSWRLKGEILKFKFLAEFLGLPDSCYKTVEFNGEFKGRLPRDTKGALLHTEIIEGGESGAFRFFHDNRLFTWFAEADSFYTDYSRIDNSVGFYMYLTPEGMVELR